MTEVNKKDKMNAIFVCLIVVFNIYGLYLQSTIGINSIVLPIVFVALLVMNNGKQLIHLKLDSFLMGLLAICMMICVIQVPIAESPVVAVKYVFYFIVCILVSQVSTEYMWHTLKRTIILISCIMSADALFHLPKLILMGYNFYNVRKYTMLDKPLYTLLLTFSIVFLFVDLLYRDNKHKAFKVAGIILFSGVNILIIQSKASLLCLVVGLVAAFFTSNKTTKRRILLTIFVVGLGLAVYFTMNPTSIPLYVKGLLHQLFGLYSDEVNSLDRYLDTYSIRDQIYSNALSLYFSHPILGIGFGNYSEYGLELNGITDMESSVLCAFVEGGTLYGISVMLIATDLLFRTLRVTKANRHNAEFTTITIVEILYFILNFQNDYMNLVYWSFIGVLIAYLRKNKIEIKFAAGQNRKEIKVADHEKNNSACI